MVHWAHAMAAMGNPYTWPVTGKALRDGMAAVEKAGLLAPKTEREQDYIASVEYFFKDFEKIPGETRQLAYELSMASWRLNTRMILKRRYFTRWRCQPTLIPTTRPTAIS